MTNQNYSLELLIEQYGPLNGPVAWIVGEIERLREENKRLEAEREAADSLIAKLYGENERLKAENKQLRGRLTAIKKILDDNCLAVAQGDDLEWRVEFALRLLGERGDDLSNIRLGLLSSEELRARDED